MPKGAPEEPVFHWGSIHEAERRCCLVRSGSPRAVTGVAAVLVQVKRLESERPTLPKILVQVQTNRASRGRHSDADSWQHAR